FPRFNKKFNLNTNFHDWFRFINKIKDNPIRVTSDEISYPLHIILRFEIESGLIDGSIKVKDLPSVWNRKMQEYLNIKPKNNSEGVLQDVHWSLGSIGYFPTYALGVIYAAQLYKKLLKDRKNIESEIEKGNFSNVEVWLKNNFHSYGSTLKAEEIIKKTCKQGLNPDILVGYLKKKYSQIYKL
ncbi:MAG: carboxypeptidase M32, partial [Candidatus Nanoarchaeia archaeon]|nr:carboxypeptidase M32 [Candidatus Nanoarchaeia archaeon]